MEQWKTYEPSKWSKFPALVGKPWKCGLNTLKRRTQRDWQQFLICCQQDLISSLCRAIQAKSTKNRELFSTSSSADDLWCPHQGGATSPDGSSVRWVWHFLWTAASSAGQCVMGTGNPWPGFTSLSVPSVGMHSISPQPPVQGICPADLLLSNPRSVCWAGLCFCHQQHWKQEGVYPFALTQTLKTEMFWLRVRSGKCFCQN